MKSPVNVWRNQKKVSALLGKTGKIITWTGIAVPPAGFSDQAPYPVVLVEFDDGRRFTGQLVDWEQKDVHVGQTVQTVVRKIMEPNNDGVIPYGIKVKPIHYG